ncbi:hypothetical protein OG780_28690 [Streptomyces sp. NBC_00386]|uniref:hypothetical protein n=1 Tax=Streptomyces sp. NBC_00386 TaxID=2975734 RepID=UPI002E1F3FA9
MGRSKACLITISLAVALVGCGKSDYWAGTGPSQSATSASRKTTSVKPESPRKSDAGSSRPSISPSIKKASPKSDPPQPKKVTLSLGEIADTPDTLAQFKEFVAEYGTAEQKTAVAHLKKWRGYSRKAYPGIEAESDFPTVDYESDGATDEAWALEEQSQYIAAAFAAWWKIDEPSVIAVYDRGGKYTAGLSCIRTDSFEVHGSCV